VHFEENGSPRVCDVVVVPLAAPPESRESTFVVLFEATTPTPTPTEPLPDETDSARTPLYGHYLSQRERLE
jgi:hypothetical protein